MMIHPDSLDHEEKALLLAAHRNQHRADYLSLLRVDQYPFPLIKAGEESFQTAEFARAVETLEERGLLRVSSDRKDGRVLTLDGRALAKRLTMSAINPAPGPTHHTADLPTGTSPKRYDVFLCHAGEDKQDVAEPLANELGALGVSVWIDKQMLTIGDKLWDKINDGLRQSHYGIVVISLRFFEKRWPQEELNGLVQKEMNGEKVILPVWHNVAEEDVRNRSPLLASRVAGDTKSGIPQLAKELLRAIRK